MTTETVYIKLVNYLYTDNRIIFEVVNSPFTDLTSQLVVNINDNEKVRYVTFKTVGEKTNVSINVVENIINTLSFQSGDYYFYYQPDIILGQPSYAINTAGSRTITFYENNYPSLDVTGNPQILSVIINGETFNFTVTIYTTDNIKITITIYLDSTVDVSDIKYVRFTSTDLYNFSYDK